MEKDKPEFERVSIYDVLFSLNSSKTKIVFQAEGFHNIELLYKKGLHVSAKYQPSDFQALQAVELWLY